jgi:hypothetical protein
MGLSAIATLPAFDMCYFTGQNLILETTKPIAAQQFIEAKI